MEGLVAPRFTPRLAVALTAAVALALPSVAARADEPIAVRVEAGPCGDARSIAARVFAQGGRAARAGEEARTLEVRVARVAGQLRGEVTVQGEGGAASRSVDATTCDELLRGIDLVVALVLTSGAPADSPPPPGPSGHPSADGLSAPPPPVPAASTLPRARPALTPRVDASGPRVPRHPRADDRSRVAAATTAEAHHRTRWRIGAVAMHETDFTMGLGYAVDVSREAPRGWTPSARLGRVHGLVLLPALGVAAPRDVTRLTLCPFRGDLQNLFVHACAGGEFGSQSVTHRSRTTTRGPMGQDWVSERASAEVIVPYWGALVRAGVRWNAGRWIFLEWDLGATVRLTRPRILVTEQGETQQETLGPFSFAASFSLGVYLASFERSGRE